MGGSIRALPSVPGHLVTLSSPQIAPAAPPADNAAMAPFAAVRRESLVRYLSRHVAGEVRFDDTSRRLYATDASHYQAEPPGVVVPTTRDHLVAPVHIAAEPGVP